MTTALVDMAPPEHELRGFKTIGEQLTELRHMAANPKQRVKTGMKSLDLLILGPASGEVFTFVARSHVGKSMIATNIMLNNPTSGIVFFSLEMPAHQVLERLYAHMTDTSGRDVVRMMMENRLPSNVEWLATEYQRHVVVDRSGMTLGDMAVYLDNYEGWYGQRPDAVIIDYLEEVGGAKASGEGWQRTEATASALKAWSKDEKMAVFSLHQANASVTEQWEPPVARSARGGGYVESDVVVGMWRPGWDPDLGPIEQAAMADDLYMNVIKNRVTGRMTRPDHPLKFRLSDSGKLVDLRFDENLAFYGSW